MLPSPTTVLSKSCLDLILNRYHQTLSWCDLYHSLFIDESKVTNESLVQLGVIEMMNQDVSSPPSHVSGHSSPTSNTISRLELRPYDMIADFIRTQAAKEPTQKIWVSFVYILYHFFIVIVHHRITCSVTNY